MIQKILGGVAAILLVVASTLAFQLHGARSEVTRTTSERDVALQDASNAKSAQKATEAQNGLWANRFDALDRRLDQIEKTRKENDARLAASLTALSNIQKSEGDSDASFACLDLSVPGQLDQWLLNGAAGANGGH